MRPNPLSQKTIKERAKIFNAAFVIAFFFALIFALNSNWKGYDETRIETYQYYTFQYENNVLTEIRVKSTVFNVMCDEFNDTEHNCTLTNKKHMREFKALVNR
jgi:hypothetical protein